MRERRLQRDAKEEHQSSPGVPVRCAGCHEPIVGPRWQCMQCDGCVELCVACLCVAAATSGPPLKLTDGRAHQRGHCFRRVRQPLLLAYSSAEAGERPSRPSNARGADTLSDGVLELNASHVDLRPGLGTAAAAAARAAEARAAEARSRASSSSATPAPSAGGGSRKRCKHPTAASIPGRGQASARSDGCGSTSHELIELSSDEDLADELRGTPGAANDRQRTRNLRDQGSSAATAVDLCDSD